MTRRKYPKGLLKAVASEVNLSYSTILLYTTGKGRNEAVKTQILEAIENHLSTHRQRQTEAKARIKTLLEC
ncbi:hypothetical protein CAPN010_10990 [Capnocytophaga cynodegmi]|uniref:hypothetical protein n=1 Tax=Capnocytophaga cynodegmi TaxID=28189 RepID=UPI001EE1AAA1|nr:hypothetical protein [Capnocytophaga cynodegmi]GJQ06941.1 hypothetical protein CAPN010_10990 [Capnocytophaga cynodegmi]